MYVCKGSLSQVAVRENSWHWCTNEKAVETDGKKAKLRKSFRKGREEPSDERQDWLEEEKQEQ